MDEYDDEKMSFLAKEPDDTNIILPEDSDDLYDISDLLKQQVNEEFEDNVCITDEERDLLESTVVRKKKKGARKGTPKKRLKFKLLKIFAITTVSFSLIGLLLVGTNGGRRLGYKLASHVILSFMNREEVTDSNTYKLTYEDIYSKIFLIAQEEQEEILSTEVSAVRKEDYVSNYLIFGIEEMFGAKNSDTMMIASINTKDNSIKLTSLMRDTYVEIPGWKSNKLNAAYARGGTSMLIDTIEHNYKIKIDGYAHVNFQAFEQIIDLLGGITIELGSAEANYLNTTNYISNPAYRNVKPGINNLNGNQVLGYCRIRKVVTLGGANNDYGRTVRQRRVLNAIFEKYKTKSIFELLMLMDDCLELVTTDLKVIDIQNALENVVERGITAMDTFRVPVDGMFDDPYEFGGVTYPLVLDWEANIKELYKFLYLDTDEEAAAALAALAEE